MTRYSANKLLITIQYRKHYENSAHAARSSRDKHCSNMPSANILTIVILSSQLQCVFLLPQQTRPEKQLSSLASGPPPPAAIVPRSAADGPRPPGWNGQPRRHGSSRFNVHNHNQELVKLPPIKGKLKKIYMT